MDATLLTPSGLRKLTSELELLRANREALLPAEPLDSNELARLHQQIAVLEDRLAYAVVVYPDPGDDELDVGETARVRDFETGEVVEYRIVGAGEANPAAGSISYTSPVGAALLGRRVGDVVEVEVPSGLLRLEVVEIGI